MNFWMTVLAVFIGLVAWDISTAVVKALIDRIPERREQKRRIGFEGAEVCEKADKKEVAMRKIGFGAND